MVTEDPTRETEEHDQAEFDEASNRDGKIVLAWLGGSASSSRCCSRSSR